jgi:sucrose phosphorylase
LATPNDYEGVERTGINRSINRHTWDYDRLVTLLEDPTTSNAKVLRELCRRIQIRRRQGAFHPNATQYTLHPGNKSLFVFWRQSLYRDQSIFCVNNLSDREQAIRLTDLNLIITDPWRDLLSNQSINDIYSSFILTPYQSAWITNKF